MKKIEKIVTIAAAGVLGIVGAAYAAHTTMAGNLTITPDANHPGSLVVESGALGLGMNYSTPASIRLSGATSMPTWWVRNSDGQMLLLTDSGSRRNVRIQNDGGGLHADLNVTSGDVNVESGGVNVDDGDITVGNGDLNIAGGIKFDGSGSTIDASVTATSGGDVVIQLGN